MARLPSPATFAAGVLLGALGTIRRRRAFDLRGRCALVSGGSRGLGLVLARELAGRGARLVLAARDAGELARAERELSALGAEVLTHACDVGDREQVEALVAAAEERFGAVEVLLNVASIIQVAPAEALSLEDLRAAMDANFWGTVHTTLAVLPSMRARGEGRIVDVTSIGGTVAVPHLLGYTSAKFAAVGFSTGLGAEMARHGVVVTTVVPGLMRTGSFLRALVKGRRDAEASIFSVASSLPVLTMDAGRAARRILRACERGERFVTLGVPYKALRVAAALAPGWTGAVFELVSRVLPGPGPDVPGTRPDEAWRHRRGAARSAVTALGDRAAVENAEQPGWQH